MAKTANTPAKNQAAKKDQTPVTSEAALDEAALLRLGVQSLSTGLAVERETVKRLERIVQVLTLEPEKLRQSSGPANVRPSKRSAH